jgi:hypothetical protein
MSQCSTIKRSDFPLLAINFSLPTPDATARSGHVQRIAWCAIGATFANRFVHAQQLRKMH